MVAQLVSVWLLVGAGEAQGPLDRAWAAWADMDYDRVTPLLDEVEQAPLDDPKRARYLELRALISATYGQRQAAEAAFVELLALAPDYALPPGTAPKIADALAAARRLRAGMQPPAGVGSPSAIEEVSPTPPPLAAVPTWAPRLGVEAGSGLLLGAPQTEAYQTVGAGVGLRLGLGRAPFVVELQGGWLSFASRDGGRAAQVWCLAAGGALEQELGSRLAVALRAHAGGTRTGHLVRFVWDVGLGVDVVLPALRLGPFVRYLQIVAGDRAGRVSGDARVLLVGAAVELGPLFR